MSQLRSMGMAMRVLLVFVVWASGAFGAQPASPGLGRGSMDQDAGGSDSRAELVTLLEGQVDPLERDWERLEKELWELRLVLTDEIFELFCLQGIPAAWRAAETGFLGLDGDCVRLLERCLVSLPLDRLRLLFGRIERREAREPQRVKAFQLLAKTGTAGDVTLMLDLARPLGSRGGMVGLAMRRKLEAALVRLGERDARVTWELGANFRDLHEGLQPSLVNVLGQIGNLESLGVLTDVLNSERRLDPYVLNAIAHCARRVPHPIDAALLDRVRISLGVSDEHIALGAMAAMGPLEDFDALPFLINAVGSEDSLVRQQAGRSLVELTGLRYGEHQESWQRWFKRESAWWDKDVPGLRRDLQNGTEAEARAAIERISAAKLDRHRLSELLLPALRREEPELLRLVCVGLARKRSPLSIKPLVQLLRHREEIVVSAAHQALMGITGMKMPADPQLWAVQTASF